MRYLIHWAIFATFIFISGVSAQGIDEGATPMLCSIVTVVECGEAGDCIKGTAKTYNLPTFLRVNFDQNTITGTNSEGKALKAEIMSSHKQQGNLLMQGNQNGRAWSVLVNQAKGDMSASINIEDGGYLLFGACVIP